MRLIHPFSINVAAMGAALLISLPLSAQEALPLLGVEVDLAEYGLARPQDVRRGRVAVAYMPEGPKLGMYYLREDPIPPRVTYPDPPPIPERSNDPDVETRQTALWVWTTDVLLRDPAERQVFLDFVERQGITRVFLHLAWAEGTSPQSGFIPFSSEEFGPFLAELGQRGALAYALDGDRDYVLERNHAGVFRTVERLVEHNRSVPPEQRFHGIRYDIEPYLSAGFQGPARQDRLDGYVELIAGVSRIARAGGLAVAVDIPFWFDAPDEETGLYMEAHLDGERAPILEHIMSVVDDVAIMDYRTDAMGPNGVLTHAYHEMELGEKMGVDVYVGVETVPLPDEDLLTFFGPVDEGLPTYIGPRWIVLEEGADERIRVWVVDSEAALAELAERTRDATFLRHWPASRPTRVAADLQTFNNLGAERMREVTEEVVRYLVTRPAFVGLAFHDYRGVKALYERN